MRDRDSPARAPVGGSAARATGSVYAYSYAVLAAALGLRHLLWGSIGGNLPFVTLFGAVAAAVWLGGWPIAVAVATTGYLGTALLFALEDVRPVFPQLGGSVGLFAYLFTCSLIIAIGEAMGRAQARADARGELLRVTLHSIGDAVITTDVASHIQSMNAVAESLTGWTEAEAVGRPLETVFQIVDEATREPVDNPVTRALRHGVVVGIANHAALIAKKGDEHSIDDSAAPITDARGRVSGCVLVFREDTVQGRAARELANHLHTAPMLASIIESSDDAIIAKSLDGIIQSWNAGAERIFRHTAAHAIGRHISLIVPPDRRAEEEGIIARLAKG